MRYKNRILHVVIFLLIFIASQAHAKDDVSIRAYADRNSITIGDRIKYTIEITASRGAQIQMPAFKDRVIGDFEIKDSESKMAKHLFGRKTFYSWYYITAYSAGKKDIPQIDIKYKLKGVKDWALKKTDAITINIQSLLPKEMPADIKEIKGPAFFFEINWFLVGGMLALLIILIAAFIAYKKIRDKKPVMLPHETAFEELEAIRSQLIRSGDIKEYFVGVSDCIRRYIERVFRLKAPEMTSEEFLNSLRSSTALSIPQKEILRAFMNACDLVKFAKYKPTGAETENVYVTAKNFVEETKDAK